MLGEVEARAGIEPAIKGFADLSLTAWVPRHFEVTAALPAVSCLGVKKL
jgi:hypothetical protein